MGKNFSDEVKFLPQAVAWACAQDVLPLERAFNGFSARSLLAIGSGGSTTAAAFLAQLHESAFGQVSRGTTPGDFLSQDRTLENAAVVLVSAEGKNQDILATAERVDFLEIPSVGVVLAGDSPLAEQCNCKGASTVIVYPMPWKKDGYLATNSLVATLILFARAYKNSTGAEFDDLDSDWLANRQKLIQDQGLVKHVLERGALAVLFGSYGRVGAIDIESKFAEAAFGSCEITDFRQFAHGRHLQLIDAERAPCFVVFSDGVEDVLCDSTLAFFPEKIPVVRLPLPSDQVKASVISVIDSILITDLIGQGLFKDPGQPFVSQAARGMHQLKVSNLFPRKKNDFPAIRRKIPLGASNVVVSDWVDAGNIFCEKLANSKIKALVCDFDGTFCNTEGRFHGLDMRLIPVIERLLRGGMTLAFASGRGDSLHNEVPSVFRLPKGGFHATSFSFCCSLSQFSMN